MINALKNYGKTILLWPSRHIAWAITGVLVVGFLLGLIVDTKSLQNLIVPITIVMIYAAMIGFKPKELFNRSQSKLTITVMILNFTLIPLIAYLLGLGFLMERPELFAGLALAALLPTSNMTIGFTMLAKGNVPAAVRMTTVGLLLGAVLAPWYLYFMVGDFVNVDVMLILKTVALIILIPLVAGMLTYFLLSKKYTPEGFQKEIKPYLMAFSTWGMLSIILISTSLNSERIISEPDLVVLALGVQILFYGLIYLLAVAIGRKFFEEKDGLVLVFSTSLRNLSIAIGLAAVTFGATAVLMVSLALVLQPQLAAWFIMLNEKYSFLRSKRFDPAMVKND